MAKLYLRVIGKVFVLSFLIVIGKIGRAQEQITVQGMVQDSTAGIPGATIKALGESNSEFSTDELGRFKFVTKRSVTLEFSFIGRKKVQIPLNSQPVAFDGTINLVVILPADDTALEEVTVTGFGGTQKKASLVSSITTVDVKELKTASSNLTNALAGRVSGIVAFQNSGEPGLGTDNSTFFIRGLSTFGSGKLDPLILIDGVESSPTDMARLQPDDISDFSVLKDAAAASIYGARGANGVVLINTKMGKDGTPTFNFRAENRISTNTRNLNFADNITYMRLGNQAALTRSPNGKEPYSQNKINATIAGEDPYLYPNNDWAGLLIKDYTFNQGYNLNITGGSPRARYYVAGTYNKDNGILKVEPINNFNSNIRLNNYAVRSNVDFDVTKTTTLIVRMYGQFDDYVGPIGGGSHIFNLAMYGNPVMFPAVYPSEMMPYIAHPLFGSGQTVNTDLSVSSTMYINPYAEMVKGYQAYKTSNIQPQLEIKQDLTGITPGLSARGMAYLRRASFYRVNRAYQPFYYQAEVNPQTGSYDLRALNDGSATSLQPVGREYLDFGQDAKDIDSRMWIEGTINYNRIFKDKHAVGGLLVSYASSYETANEQDLIRSLPARNAGVSGRFSYGYDNRYLAEFNFGYNGSERFASNHRWGFFPSFGVGYRVSEEPFFAPLKNVISDLKLRATYGIVGNDAIGDDAQRFFYLSNVNLNDGAYGAGFGRNDGAPVYSRPGISIGRYANPAITWEQSRQINVGLDLGIANAFDLIVDAFHEKRTNILQPNTVFDNAAGIIAIPFSNYGQVESMGVDLSGSYSKHFSRDFWVNARGTFTFNTSRVLKLDELPYPTDLARLSRKGHSINQVWGYLAERLFIDDAEAANSPVQFGDSQLRGGDIKYQDMDGNGVIDSEDVWPIGYPSQPEVIYGFGATFGFKKFDFSFFFQGAGRFSFFINSAAIQPFYLEGGRQTGLLQSIADDHWSETNQDAYAFWPRMSTWRVNSNNQVSIWWMRNGSFLRLKNIDLGYNTAISQLNIKNARIYFSATNLFMMSKFKLWDAEMRGNGLGYPLQSVYNLGVQINL